ncbi:MAG: hypothetical protein JW783_05535 [Bacteroidales bacterium]|nr:hypothetical protein [Bacteroidales bacterium]MBN2748120.1 hypothetical protein [Bacteroidales bacterium]
MLTRKSIVKGLFGLLVSGALSSGASASSNLWFFSDPQDWSKRENVYRINESFSKFEIRYKGKVQVTDNDKDIKSISPNGYLTIEKSSFGNSRRLEFTSDSQGRLTRKYYEGAKERSYESDGKAWLQEVLEEAIYRTGVGGKERALRIYKSKGVYGILDEVERISSYSGSFSFGSSFFGFHSVEVRGFNVRNMYLKTLVDEASIDKKDLPLVLRAIEGVESNSTKGTLLRTIIDKYPLDAYLMTKMLQTTESLSYNTEMGNVLRKFQSKYRINLDNYDAYFDVIRRMSINSEKGNVLKPLANSQKLEDRVMVELIRSVGQFSSESEKAAVLRVVATKMSDNTDVVREYIRTVSGIGDSYRYLRDELLEMVAANGVKPNQPINKAGVLSLLAMADGYTSNTPKTVTLRRVNVSLGNDSELVSRYFDVVGSLTNEMEQYALMLDLLYSQNVGRQILSEMFRVAESLANRDYKHGATAILREAIPYLPADGSLHKDFFDVLERVDHDSGKEEIVRMFCERGNVDAKLAVYLLAVVEDMEVDVERATSMILIYRSMPKDENLDYIFDSVAKKMESDYDYEKVMIAKK